MQCKKKKATLWLPCVGEMRGQSSRARTKIATGSRVIAF
jgi:hypothetical protein